MHSKQLTAFILVCIFYVTTVQARDDLRKNLFQESFQKRDSLSESQEKQERSYASNIHGLLLADRRNLFERRFGALHTQSDESDSYELTENRRGSGSGKQLDNDLLESLEERADGTDYSRPIENDRCGRQQFAPTFQGRIVGGYEAAPHSWPWQVLYEESVTCASGTGNCVSLCGGTLINENYVLTAAHCINSGNPESIKIVAGLHNKMSDEEEERRQVKTVAQIFIYPGWDSGQIKNDIAILRLAESVNFNEYVQPACLPGPDPLPDSEVILTGWGRVSTNGETSAVLKQTTARVTENCHAEWSMVDDAKQLCFKDPTLTSSACRGDSGGPALQKHGDQWVVEGVTSFGHKLCEKISHGKPDVYTRVSAYLSWIHSIIDN